MHHYLRLHGEAASPKPLRKLPATKLTVKRPYFGKKEHMKQNLQKFALEKDTFFPFKKLNGLLGTKYVLYYNTSYSAISHIR